MTVESTGTPSITPQVGGVDTGTAGAAGEGGDAAIRAENERLKAANEQHLREKSNNEAERRRLLELEQENEQLRRGQGTAPATPQNPWTAAALQIQQDFQAAQQMDDPVARLAAANTALLQQQDLERRRERMYDAELRLIPLSEHKAVEELAAKQGLSPSLAFDRIKSQRYDAERTDLDIRRKKLDEEEEAKKRGRVDVSTTPISASDLSNAGYSPADYKKDIELSAQGNTEARRRLDDHDKGILRFSSG